MKYDHFFYVLPHHRFHHFSKLWRNHIEHFLTKANVGVGKTSCSFAAVLFNSHSYSKSAQALQWQSLTVLSVS